MIPEILQDTLGNVYKLLKIVDYSTTMRQSVPTC